ncbi:hypothetical protein [Psychrobacter sp. H7-1]|uniref:hypothetical protein n=1 Tax=Psychrobacter sp. H7-1 TaxID=1569265 RepID=UPI001917A99A|nr:hypothetical protein [Psychrobacter sp. H7-1]
MYGFFSIAQYSYHAIKRFNENGSLDTSFGSNGEVRITNGQHISISSIESFGNGQLIVVGGTNDYKGNPISFIKVLDSSGQLDTKFHSNNSFIFDNTNNYDFGVRSLVTSKGDIILLTNEAIIKYDQNGNILFKTKLSNELSVGDG